MSGGGGGSGNDSGGNDMQVSGMEAAVSQEKGISTHSDSRVSDRSFSTGDGGGGSGDTTEILRELVRRGAQQALVGVINDAAAAARHSRRRAHEQRMHGSCARCRLPVRLRCLYSLRGTVLGCVQHHWAAPVPVLGIPGTQSLQRWASPVGHALYLREVRSDYEYAL